MAKAIATALKEVYEIEIVGRNITKVDAFCDELGIRERCLIEEFSIDNKYVILAVKPYVLDYLSFQGRAKAIFSVMAGKSIASLQKIESDYYVRVMPNIGAYARKSTTTLTGDISIKEKALEIFLHIGSVFWLESEKALDISTAIIGSGPAFLALVAEAMADSAVNCGLKRDEAYALSQNLFESYASLKAMKPSEIKDQVMSPGGTTAAGYVTLEEEGVRQAFIKAIGRAYEKSQKI